LIELICPQAPVANANTRVTNVRSAECVSTSFGLCVMKSAATAIEYGLIAAGIALAIIAVVGALGTQLNTTFSSVSSAIK
jgi:pilus assembly protein Flp/PilA